MANKVAVVFASAAAAGLILIGLILNGVSVGTDYWISFSSGGINVANTGLWRQCVIGSSCQIIPISDAPAWLHAARALTVAAGALAIVAVAPLLILSTVIQKPVTSLAAITVAIVPSLLLGAGVLTWVGGIELDLRPDNDSFGVPITYDWSFALACVGVGFYFFGAIALGVQGVAACTGKSSGFGQV